MRHNPSLGYLSTFGGHPVSCAAGLAALEVLYEENLRRQSLETAESVQDIFKKADIEDVRGKGLFLAIGIKQPIMEAINNLFQRRILAEGFLYKHLAIRFAPPLSVDPKTAMDTAEQIVRVLQCD